MSTVPKRISPCSARRRSPSYWSKQIADLGAGKVGVQEKARSSRGKVLFDSFRFETLSSRGAGPALPDHRPERPADRCGDPREWSSRTGWSRLPRQYRGPRGMPWRALPRHVELRGPDGLGIVFHKPRRRPILRKFLLRGRHDSTTMVENDRAARCRSLVQGQNILIHFGTSRLLWRDSLPDRLLPGKQTLRPVLSPVIGWAIAITGDNRNCVGNDPAVETVPPSCLVKDRTRNNVCISSCGWHAVTGEAALGMSVWRQTCRPDAA